MQKTKKYIQFGKITKQVKNYGVGRTENRTYVVSEGVREEASYKDVTISNNNLIVAKMIERQI